MLTNTENCTIFTLTTDLALEIEGVFTVRVTYNGKDIYNVDEPTIEGNIVTVIPSNLDTEYEIFKDGIYEVCLIQTLEDNSINSYCQCTFVDCETRCLVAESVLCDNLEAYKFYRALQDAEGCGDCECENMIKLYNALVTELSKKCITKKDDCKTC